MSRISKFKATHPLSQRKAEAERIRKKYPDRYPLIIEKSDTRDGLTDIDKNKFLIPNDLTIGQLSFVIRKRINLGPEQALFLFINNEIPPVSAMIGNLYNQFIDEDGFMYVVYSGETTFGKNGKDF